MLFRKLSCSDTYSFRARLPYLCSVLFNIQQKGFLRGKRKKIYSIPKAVAAKGRIHRGKSGPSESQPTIFFLCSQTHELWKVHAFFFFFIRTTVFTTICGAANWEKCETPTVHAPVDKRKLLWVWVRAPDFSLVNTPLKDSRKTCHKRNQLRFPRCLHMSSRGRLSSSEGNAEEGRLWFKSLPGERMKESG